MVIGCKKILLFVIAVLLLSTTVAVLRIPSVIKKEVMRICCTAQTQYTGKSKVEALIEVLKSDTQSLDAKNDAVYALGYVRDRSALPALQALKTGNSCDHHHFVCQRGLDRTIRYIEGREINVFDFR